VVEVGFVVEEGVKVYNIGHRCYFFAKDIILFVKDFRMERVYEGVFSQLVNSASSIGANVLEGKAGSSKKDWIKYLNIALKSANETKYWLCLIRDTMEVDLAKIRSLIEEADAISKIIASIIIKAKKEKTTS
jgi:four helix bundle protein